MSRTDLQPGCEAAKHRTVRVHGPELHLLEWGEAGRPALCFLHGGSAHAHWFDLVAPAFADRFHVIALDQRGHGESAWPVPPAYATEDFARDLLDVMEALGWARMALVGHSMGSHNAMAFAGWHPDRLIALGIVDGRPSFAPERLTRLRERGRRPPRRHPTRETALAAFRLEPRDTLADPRLLAHLAAAGLIERDGRWMYRFDPACSALRRPVDAWPLLPRITAPTLIVRGERSQVLPLEVAERMRATIPKATLVEIPGAYHHVVLDTPREFVDALDAFLAP